MSRACLPQISAPETRPLLAPSTEVTVESAQGLMGSFLQSAAEAGSLAGAQPAVAVGDDTCSPPLQ